MWQEYIDNVHKIALQFIHEYKKSGMPNIKSCFGYINNCFGLVKYTITNTSLGGVLGKQDTDFKQFLNSDNKLYNELNAIKNKNNKL